MPRKLPTLVIKCPPHVRARNEGTPPCSARAGGSRGLVLHVPTLVRNFGTNCLHQLLEQLSHAETGRDLLVDYFRRRDLGN